MLVVNKAPGYPNLFGRENKGKRLSYCSNCFEFWLNIDFEFNLSCAMSDYYQYFPDARYVHWYKHKLKECEAAAASVGTKKVSVIVLI